MDLPVDAAQEESATPLAIERLRLVTASAEEVAAHEAVLDGIAKEARREPVWRARGDA
jgi:heme exporter protein D